MHRMPQLMHLLTKHSSQECRSTRPATLNALAWELPQKLQDVPLFFIRFVMALNDFIPVGVKAVGGGINGQPVFAFGGWIDQTGRKVRRET